MTHVIHHGCQIHQEVQKRFISHDGHLLHSKSFIHSYNTKVNMALSYTFPDYTGRPHSRSVFYCCASVHVGPESLSRPPCRRRCGISLKPGASPLFRGPVRVLVGYSTVQALNTGKRQVPFVKLFQKRGKQSFV